MKFWDYIAGFYLLRWLFGSNHHNDSGCNDSGTPGGYPHDDIYYNDNSTDAYGGFLDDPDDFLDDSGDFLDEDF